RQHALGVDDPAHIDRQIDARNANPPFLIDVDLDDGGDVAEKALVRREAERAPVARLPLRPLRSLRDHLDDPPEPTRIEWILLEGLAVVGVHRALRLEVELAGGTDDVEQGLHSSA